MQYEVEVLSTSLLEEYHTVTVKVEAASPEEARVKVQAMIELGPDNEDDPGALPMDKDWTKSGCRMLDDARSIQSVKLLPEQDLDA